MIGDAAAARKAADFFGINQVIHRFTSSRWVATRYGTAGRFKTPVCRGGTRRRPRTLRDKACSRAIRPRYSRRSPWLDTRCLPRRCQIKTMPIAVRMSIRMIPGMERVRKDKNSAAGTSLPRSRGRLTVAGPGFLAPVFKRRQEQVPDADCGLIPAIVAGRRDRPATAKVCSPGHPQPKPRAVGFPLSEFYPDCNRDVVE